MILRHIKEQMVYLWAWPLIWFIAFLSVSWFAGCTGKKSSITKEGTYLSATKFGRTYNGNRFWDVSCKEGFHSYNCTVFYISPVDNLSVSTYEINCTDSGCTFSDCHDQ